MPFTARPGLSLLAVVALLIAMQPPLAPGRQGLGKRAVEGAASDTGHASKDEDPVVLTHTQAKQRSADKILTSDLVRSNGNLG